MPAFLLSGPNTRDHFPSLLEEGIREIYDQRYPLYDTGFVEEIFNVSGSQKAAETDAVRAQLGLLFPKSEGGVPIIDSMQEVYKKTVTHVTFALYVEFTEEAIEDNLYVNLVGEVGDALAQAAAYTRTILAYDFFNDLTQTVYSVGGTNFPLLSETHFRLDGGVWSNRPNIPTGFSQAALEERLQAWTVNMINQRGLKMGTRPAVLMVGAQDEFQADVVLNTPQRAETADNDLNPVRRRRKLRLFMNPHLNTDGRWFLVGPKNMVALTQFDRVAAGVNNVAPGLNGNLRYRCRARWSHHSTHVYNISGSPGSA
jgi:hypothetical protein